MKKFLFAAVVVAMTSTQSYAGCGLLSKIFGGRCSSQSSGSCVQSKAVVVAEYHEHSKVESKPEVVRVSAPSCANGQCQSSGVLQIERPRSFRIFR